VTLTDEAAAGPDLPLVDVAGAQTEQERGACSPRSTRQTNQPESRESETPWFTERGEGERDGQQLRLLHQPVEVLNHGEARAEPWRATPSTKIQMKIF
jgi:hypothetical protein